MPRWTKIALKVFAVIFGLLIVLFVTLALYVNANKKKLLISVTKELNKGLNGKMTIGSMDPTFLKGFPGVSLSLNHVVIRDSLWQQHHHTLLDAKNFTISVNALALLRGVIEIKKIGINNASVYLFTDQTGYGNASVFKQKNESDTTAGSSSAELRRFELNNVNFILDNKKGHKLFWFSINDLKGNINYPDSGWHADFNLNILAHSFAFNTLKGSFIKERIMDGPFSVSYNNKTEVVTLKPNKLNIGGNSFVIDAWFSFAKDPVQFSINIVANDILWKNASALLAPNISSRLNRFDFKSPINAKCEIAGNMGGGADPSLYVTADVKNNILTMPGGIVDSCSFSGVYTNNFINGKGFNDANSAVKLYHFMGTYEKMPFVIDTAFIDNFNKPIATGIFKSKFSINKLNNLLGDDLLKFTNGSADVKLAYKADIVNFKLTKPIIRGWIDIKNADVSYVPRRLNFKNTSISLHFTDKDLFIKNIRLQSGKSIVYMEGDIRNFLNLYYNAPEKILLSWQIHSPQLYLGEFLGFLGTRRSVAAKKKRPKTSLSQGLNSVFEKSKVDMHLQVDKVYYDKFMATNARADILLSESGINLKNVTVKHAGGAVKLYGNITHTGSFDHFTVNAVVNNVDIKNFFYSFDNFGLTSITSKNLKGYLFSKTKISGNLTDRGKIVPRSINGSVIFDLKKGGLINFEPITNVGKFAFPLRDLNNITFSNLNGKFDIHGEKITINPMQISSSVLNMDIAGVYSFSKGTNITLDVPLRNPQKDGEVTSTKERQEKRMKGIVLHLLATDGEDGKIKIKLTKNHNKENQ